MTLLGVGLLYIQAFSQGSPDYGSGMKLNIDKEGTKSIRFIFWNQIWLRSVENNPGTLVNGNSESNTWDVGARRLRFLALAQISPRYLIVAHVGINNQTFLNGGAAGTAATTGGYGPGKKPGLFFHDAWNEYAILPAKKADGSTAKFSLYAGAGLHYWNGISRMTSASTLNFLTVDAPVFNWPLIENSDQFARQYGIYIKGRAGKAGYQFHMNKPFATNSTTTLPNVAVDKNTGKTAWGGYVDYQFLDQESNVLPFRVGTYMGTKRVFNIGAGFYQNSEGTEHWVDTNAATKKSQKNDIFLFSVDAFADLPIGNKERNMAITAYSVLYNFDFGPNYLRSIGIMNTGVSDPSFTGTKAIEGAGDARYALGTGTIWYTQAGLLLPKQISKKVRFQPFAAIAMKNFEALSEAGNYWDVGSNFFIDGHNAKVTAQYSNRPLYDNTKKVFDNKGEFILQFQVYL